MKYNLDFSTWLQSKNYQTFDNTFGECNKYIQIYDAIKLRFEMEMNDNKDLVI